MPLSSCAWHFARPWPIDYSAETWPRTSTCRAESRFITLAGISAERLMLPERRENERQARDRPSQGSRLGLDERQAWIRPAQLQRLRS
jgi:hypothetical protein